EGGDSTSRSTASISGPNSSGVFTVKGGHTYAEEGSYTVTVTLKHDTAPDATVTSTASVTDPAVVGTAVTFSAVEGTAFSSQTVATVTGPGGPEWPSE